MSGVSVGTDDRGRLTIDAPAICPQRLVTNDIAEIDTRSGHSRFKIRGRADNTICTGGIKIQAEEVERLLEPHIPYPFVITWTPDARLGQAVTLVIENEDPGIDTERIKQICEQTLPKFWRPKIIRTTERIPRTETGKLKRNFTQSA